MNAAAGAGCIDADTALSLHQLLEEAGLPSLEHIVGCETCGEPLETWSRIGQAMGDTPVRAGFADEVLSALPAPRHASAAAWGIRALNAGLSFVAAALVLVTLQAAPSLSALLVASGLAALVGLGAGSARLAAAEVPAGQR